MIKTGSEKTVAGTSFFSTKSVGWEAALGLPQSCPREGGSRLGPHSPGDQLAQKVMFA